MEGPGSGQLKSIEWLSHGGKDIINNKAALYPNCYCKIYRKNAVIPLALAMGI
jgi:hypothetical protein